jgi:opacity protein-like surface antigen
MKKGLFLCSAILVMVGLSASLATAAVGPYFSLHGGATWLEDSDLDYDGVPSFVFSGEAEFDTGYNLGAAMGYDYGPARLEAEIAYRENEFDQFNVQEFGDSFVDRADGDVSATSLMINAFLDLTTGSPITPYIGGGVGFANVSFNDVQEEINGVFFNLADDDDNVLALQFAAGIAFEINPSLTLDLGYRYFVTEDPEIEVDPDLVIVDDFGNVFDELDAEYESHNVSLGLRFLF